MKSIDELSVRYLPLVMLLLFEEKAVEVVVYEKRLSSNDGTTSLCTEAIFPLSTLTLFLTYSLPSARPISSNEDRRRIEFISSD